MTEPLLSCEGLCKSFADSYSPILHRPRHTLRAVDRITLQLHAGEILGIVGESGSGKSTAAELLGGLQTPDSGIVRFRGEDTRSLRGDSYRCFRRSVQYVFQDPLGSMNPNASILSILTEPLYTLRLEPSAAKRRQRAEEICDTVGLESAVLRKRPRELSGGQAQRIAIGRALISRPELLICDEAVSALDVSIQAQILNLLKELREQYRIACLFISHDISVVNFLADRIAVMYQGRLIEEGAATELLQAPREEYTKLLLRDTLR